MPEVVVEDGAVVVDVAGLHLPVVDHSLGSVAWGRGGVLRDEGPRRFLQSTRADDNSHYSENWNQEHPHVDHLGILVGPSDTQPSRLSDSGAA